MPVTEPEQRTVSCPTCAATVAWEPSQRWRPFCSERCHLIDLGGWFDESNRIPVSDTPPDADVPADG